MRPRRNPVRHLKPSDIPVGDNITGVFLFKQPRGKYETGEGYTLDPKTKDGAYVELFSCVDLKYQMDCVKPLEIIRITRLEDKAPEGDKKYPQYKFKVEKP